MLSVDAVEIRPGADVVIEHWGGPGVLSGRRIEPAAYDGHAQLRAVDLVRRSGRSAAVSKGLVPGDRVILYPSDQIGPGVRVSSK